VSDLFYAFCAPKMDAFYVGTARAGNLSIVNHQPLLSRLPNPRPRGSTLGRANKRTAVHSGVCVGSTDNKISGIIFQPFLNPVDTWATECQKKKKGRDGVGARHPFHREKLQCSSSGRGGGLKTGGWGERRAQEPANRFTRIRRKPGAGEVRLGTCKQQARR
jgi:hypothetical protein